MSASQLDQPGSVRLPLVGGTLDEANLAAKRFAGALRGLVSPQ